MSPILGILEAIANLALIIMEIIDAKRCLDFRRRLAGDPVGVLLSQTGGDGNETITAHSDKRKESNP